MADTTEKIVQVEPEYVSKQITTQRSSLWQRLALGGILLVSIFMNFFQLGKNGFGTFYPPAVRSMMDNWHNFFFSSYDPGGFVTIDKPPVGFWLQVLSAKIFGFTPFSVLLPQAIAGVVSVLLLYHLVQRHFGKAAGLLAALGLALSPISIVTNRNVTIDSTLALVLLLGAWAVLRAAETGRLRWLLLAAALVGLGFNIKMLEAYLVVPAFGLLYLLAAPKRIWVRIVHLVLATLVLLVISLSWAVAVDLTPASQRPYVGSTQDNSELSLAFGYNGVQRLLGRSGFGGARQNRPPASTTPAGGVNGAIPTNGSSGVANQGGGANNPGNGSTASQGSRTANPQQAPRGGGGGLFDIGNPGPLRLFTAPLAGQIVWILPLALLGLVALAWLRRPRFQGDLQQQSMVLWGAWLLTTAIFFSVAGFFHQYYMTEMAPAIAALFGIGLVVMWQDYRRGGWKGWLLPLAVAVTIAEQIYVLTAYPTWARLLIPILAVLGALAVIALVVIKIAPRFKTDVPARASNIRRRLPLPALSIGVLALMITPILWAAIPIFQDTQADQLTAGPVQAEGFGGGNAGARNQASNGTAKLVSYLEANQGNAKFLVAVPSSMSADSIILATNKPVMAMGGFSGGDPILTTNQLATLIANGTVRFFLLNAPRTGQQIPAQFRNAARNGGFGGGQQSALTTYVTKHCTTVPAKDWQTSSASSTT
nr:glycosyltransferase family 39 protein [Ktedonobacteraceae bacterium]